MITKQITQSDFMDEFIKMGRNDNFSYDGKVALYNYLNDLSDDTEKNIDLDIIALCCDYTEYDTLEDLQAQYPNIKDFEDLNNHTTVIEVDNAMKTEQFIIQNF